MKFRSDMTVELIDHMGSDARFAEAARVSTKGAAAAEGGSVEGLIRSLMEKRHGTPFEHGAMTFRIEAPIFVFREFHRHRAGWSYNEESGRYKTLDPVFYIPNGERPLVQQGKAMSYDYVHGDLALLLNHSHRIARVYEDTYKSYEKALAAGIAREVARTILPVGIYSSMYATCNPRSLMHFLGLRNAPQAQYEIRMVAQQMETFFAELFPVTCTEFVNQGRTAP